METYSLTLNMPHVIMDAYKQKAINITISTIEQSALSSEMVFNSYGIAEYVDDSEFNVIVTPVDKFFRGKINCLIFDFKKTKNNPGVYNKCFIYYTATDPSYCGYILLNTETNKQVHKFSLQYGDDLLCQYLKKSISTIPRQMIYDFYSQKYDETKKYNTNKRHICTIGEYNELMKKWDEYVKTDSSIVYE